MDSNISLIKALAATLLSEIDSLNQNGGNLPEVERFNLYEKVREFEIKLIKTALLKTRGNQRQAAMLLGVKVTTLNNKVKNYNIKCLKIAA